MTNRNDSPIAGHDSALLLEGGTLTGPLVCAGAVQIPAGAAAGSVLTSDASGNASWQVLAAPASTVRTITAATVTANAHDTILGNATSNAITVTLPTATSGVRVTVKKTDSSANAVTITGVIDGVTNPALTSQYQSISLIANGSSWVQVGGVKYPAA